MVPNVGQMMGILFEGSRWLVILEFLWLSLQIRSRRNSSISMIPYVEASSLGSVS